MIIVRRRMAFAAILFSIGALFACWRGPAALPTTAPGRPSAVRDGQHVRLEPSGVAFRVPQAWLDWHAEFGNNLHLTRAELGRVKKGAWEWDTEYAAVVNAALPFDRCAAHLGEEGWGNDGVSFADIQMRAYVIRESPDQVAESVKKRGVAAAARFDKGAAAVTGRAGEWYQATITYKVWYGDYGGTAVVDVYARRVGKETIVLVFMHAEGCTGATVQEMLSSFMPPAAE